MPLQSGSDANLPNRRGGRVPVRRSGGPESLTRLPALRTRVGSIFSVCSQPHFEQESARRQSPYGLSLVRSGRSRPSTNTCVPVQTGVRKNSNCAHAGVQSMNDAIPLSRSPRYPRISLPDVLVQARKLYEGAHRSLISADTAYRVMGYSGKTGASASVLGALRQFGLVSGLRGDLSISDVAMRILEPRDAQEYSAAIHEVALAPDTFSAIHNHFAGRPPRSDEAIRAYLIRALNFGRSGADECIRSYRATQAFVAEFAPPPTSEPPHIEARSETAFGEVSCQPMQVGNPPADPQSNQGPQLQTSNHAGGEYIRVPVTKTCTAELRFIGDVSTEAIDRLMAYIDLMKPIWATE